LRRAGASPDFAKFGDLQSIEVGLNSPARRQPNTVLMIDPV
jgi:hypothetical protein